MSDEERSRELSQETRKMERTPPGEGAGARDRTISLAADLAEPDSRIGNYRLLQRVGEGGMGEVWEAQQEAPVRRRVALKLVKLGMDTREFVVRFESERQALALMDHPCIARVFDGGATERGRPFFVMEFVKGIPITRYCDQNRLTTRERLELFVQVCSGVQHAHQKGIIHRDLKPSNVLVTLQDGKPVPKIIDFGVAKATGTSLVEETLFTQRGEWVGTPAYMSPEQAGVSGLDIDTRSDVYTLGVILYEMLVGSRPFDPKQLTQGGLEELQRRIRETDPARPSTRISSLGKRSHAVAQKRRTDPRSLSRRLKGDLDWITLKALEKDRTRRYETASALAEDVERHLSDQPVSARPPSSTYRLAKFVRRHRVGVAFVTALIVTWLGFSVAVLVQTARVVRERDRANAEAETARQVSVFLEDLFEVSDPSEARGDSITAREVLDRGAERIDEELVDRPLVRARLMRTLGNVYRSIGLYDAAEPIIRGALEIHEEALGAQDPELARSLFRLALLETERGDHVAAEPLVQRALEIFERELGADDPETAESLQLLAEIAFRAGDFARAAELGQGSLDIRERVFGAGHNKVAKSLDGLGMALARQGRFEEAESHFRRSLEIYEAVLPEDHPDIATVLGNLAAVLGDLGRDDESLPLLERSLSIFEKAYGPDHRNVAIALANLAGVHGTLGRLDQAEELYRRAAEIDEAIFGPEHPETAVSYKNLGMTSLLQGEVEEAEAYLLRALAIDEAELGATHYAAIWGHNTLGSVYLRQRRLELAERHYGLASSAAEAALGGEHPELARALLGRGMVEQERGKLAAAEELVRRALAIQETAIGPDALPTAGAIEVLGDVLLEGGRAEDALQLFQRALAIRDDRLGPRHPSGASTLCGLAAARFELGEAGEAEGLYRRALAVSEAAGEERREDVARAVHGLAGVFAAASDPSRARPLFERALGIRREILGDDHPDTIETRRALAAL